MKRVAISCMALAILLGGVVPTVSADQAGMKRMAADSGMGGQSNGQLQGAPHAMGQKIFHPVDFDSLEATGPFSSEPFKIKGYVLEAGTGTKGPGAVLAPSCGGPLLPNGLVRLNYRTMARQLKDMGITSVLVDGFNPRGRTEVCTENPKQRTIDTDTRIRDSLAALRYLRSRSDVDPSKVFLVTWGAAGSMQTMNGGSVDVEKVGGGFTAAVMFFPQCDKVDGKFAPYAPIQVFVGEKDAWNPASLCLALLKRKDPSSAAMDVKVYPDTYHGFDLPGEPKPMTNAVVTNVMVGGNPVARDDAYALTKTFFTRFLGK